MSFLSSETIKIVVVKLSRTAERKKVTIAMIQSMLFCDFARMRSVMILNPLWASINSTKCHRAHEKEDDLRHLGDMMAESFEGHRLPA